MEALEKLLSLIEKTFPIPGRFRSKLPSLVAELSRLLTSARSERDSGYLNRPNLLSAYLHYFLPWNVFRLERLFSLTILPVFSDGDAITDLGSGPLTLPIALWITFPELRTIKLEFRCVDKSAAILEAGYKLFRALCNKECNWKIKTIHDSIEAPIWGKSAKLTTAINVFNEIPSLMKHSNLGQSAEKAAALLCKLTADNGSILVAEPGNPQGGAFISTLRTALLKREKYPAAPCPHNELCPLPGSIHGTKAKWCHFAFDTDTAPLALHKLSAAAGIPKERATLSFLLAGPVGGAELKRMHNKTKSPDLMRTHDNAAPADLMRMRNNSSNSDLKRMRIRIVSDTFPVPFQKSGIGCYGCSEKGMVLVTGNRTQKNELASGTLLNLPLSANEKRDPKTGALIVPVSLPHTRMMKI